MYPYLRHLKALILARRLPRLSVFEPHVSRHICWPWDLDPWGELNNGRTLTLFDLGRTVLGLRTDLDRLLVEKGWGMAVAGASVRYRRRVTMFARLTMVTRNLGWDDRFIYTEQSFWRGEECCSHILIRSAVFTKAGILPPRELALAAGYAPESPPLPDWVTAWITAEAARPWPPER